MKSVQNGLKTMQNYLTLTIFSMQRVNATERITSFSTASQPRSSHTISKETGEKMVKKSEIIGKINKS
ncbi:hypothetical protein CLI64_15640 [Nostoc sp. CENA543]|nr:hypothetical protein CLI64_15640 [Nostoc sp. CENA543]